MAITKRDIDKRELLIPQYIDKYYSGDAQHHQNI